jgi:hypothetical protein
MNRAQPPESIRENLTEFFTQAFTERAVERQAMPGDERRVAKAACTL